MDKNALEDAAAYVHMYVHINKFIEAIYIDGKKKVQERRSRILFL